MISNPYKTYKSLLLDYTFVSTHSSLDSCKILQAHLKRTCDYLDSIVPFLRFTEGSFDLHDLHWFYAYVLLKWSDSRGAKQAVLVFKYFKRYITVKALKAKDVPLDKFPVRYRNGKPIICLKICQLFQYGLLGKRISLTIANFVNLVRTSLDPSSAAITDSIRGCYPEDLHSEFSEFLKSSQLIKPVQVSLVSDWSSGYLSTKAGPNGNSLMNCVKDFGYIIQNEPQVLQNIKSLSEVLSPVLHQSVLNLEQWFKVNSLGGLPPKGSLVHQIPEGGGKTRNICIVDFWTQNALKPIHDAVFQILKKLDEDGTFDQDKAFGRAILLANKFNCCFSFDLSSATDRYPVRLQTEVVSGLFGPDIGNVWTKLLVDRDYRFRGKLVRWAVGQPLGAYSSWGVFTLTHHLFIKWCAKDPSFDRYVILGDDVIICDPEVAKSYQRNMELFGVTINLNKSFLSMGQPVYGEFCKRLFLEHDELTGLPVNLITEAFDLPSGFNDLHEWMITRWKLGLSVGSFDCYASELPAPHRTKLIVCLLRIIKEMCSTDCSGGTLSSPVLADRVKAKLCSEHLKKITNLQMDTKDAIQDLWVWANADKVLLPATNLSSRTVNEVVGLYALFIYCVWNHNIEKYDSALFLRYIVAHKGIITPEIAWMVYNDTSPFKAYAKLFYTQFTKSEKELDLIVMDSESDYCALTWDRYVRGNMTYSFPLVRDVSEDHMKTSLFIRTICSFIPRDRISSFWKVGTLSSSWFGDLSPTRGDEGGSYALLGK